MASLPLPMPQPQRQSALQPTPGDCRDRAAAGAPVGARMVGRRDGRARRAFEHSRAEPLHRGARQPLRVETRQPPRQRAAGSASACRGSCLAPSLERAEVGARCRSSRLGFTGDQYELIQNSIGQARIGAPAEDRPVNMIAQGSIRRRRRTTALDRSRGRAAVATAEDFAGRVAAGADRRSR